MKILLWFGKWLATALFVSIITLMSTWYMVNAYVDSLLRFFNLDPAQVRIPVAAFVGQAAKDWEQAGRREEGTDRPGGPPSGKAEGPADEQPDNGEVGGTDPDRDADAVPEDDAASPPPEDAVAVWGQAAGDSELVLSLEEFNETKDEISDADKLRILAIVSQLPQQSIQKLSLYMENGITQDELVNIQNMMKNHLTNEQFGELMEIMEKY